MQIKGDWPVKHLAECLAHSRYLVHESYGHYPPLTSCKWLVKGWRTRRKVALLITQTSLQPEDELQSTGRPVVRARQAHRVLGVWGQNREISELSTKNRVRLVEWESRRWEPVEGLRGLLGFKVPKCLLCKQPDLFKGPGTECLLWRCLKLPGLMSRFPACFGGVTWHLCLLQEEQKAECELGSPEASRDHGSLPGGAGLAEWAVFARSREGRGLGGRKAQKLLHGEEQGDESPLKNVIQFKMIHFHCRTFSKGEL